MRGHEEQTDRSEKNSGNATFIKLNYYAPSKIKLLPAYDNQRFLSRWLAMAIISLWVSTAVSAAEVTIKTEGAGHHVQTPAYDATVSADGKLSKLCAGGQELLTSSYVYQGGVPDMKIESADGKAVMLRGQKSAVRFEFGTGTINLMITNLTEQMIQYVIVLNPAVTAVMNDQCEYFKTCINGNWDSSTTWFSGSAKLCVSSAKIRVWGPFAGNRQVWCTNIEANGTCTMQLTIGKVTQEESTKVADIIKPPLVMTIKDEPTIIAAATKPVVNPLKKTVASPPVWNMKELGQPPKVYVADGFNAEGCQAIFYEGLPFNGHPTRVFAWLGLPKVEPGEKVPAIVLVHGGGGTAFAAWVQLWTSRGYAAIAMDTTGCVPKGASSKWERHPWSGPQGWDACFKNIDDPTDDQWTYHAVANAILANSLLRSLPEVDTNRIGLTGISWGGYLTCIVSGIDHRFRFVVPVYGCGYTLDSNFASSVLALGKERGERWMRWWDPSMYLRNAAMPMLWVDGSNDFAYTLNALQKSYRLPTGQRTLCTRLRMIHGHGGPGENPEEIRVFADSILKGGVPLLKITEQGRDGNKAWATFEGKTPVAKAELNITKDLGNWSKRKWDALPANLDAAGKVTAVLPEGVTAYYLNLFDNRGCVVSTEHVEWNNLK